MTKEELKSHAEEEFSKIEKTLREIAKLKGKPQGELTEADCASMGAFLFNVYNGLEAVLEKILLFDALRVEESHSRHEEILRKALELGILTPELYENMLNFLSFRVFFETRHSFELKWENLRLLAETVSETASAIEKEVKEYYQII